MAERKKNPGRKKRPAVEAKDIRGSKYLKPVIDLLATLRPEYEDPKRHLHYDEYCTWLLLYFYNPVLDSMRGIQRTSDIESVRKKLGLRRFSLGSFSEAGNVFDPELLKPILQTVSDSLTDLGPESAVLGRIGQRPVAVDGTLLKALPKMTWALWRDEEHRAAKLHLHLDLLKGVPEEATLTNAQASEIDALRATLRPGRLYVTDRGYFSFQLMAEILAADSSFVGRVCNNIVVKTLEERPLGDEERRAGVVGDRIVRAGFRKNSVDRPLRLVEIDVRGAESGRRARVDSKTKAYRTRETDHRLTLLTDRMDLDVSLIATLFRYRWQIELYFRWFKQILSADHMLSLSENGLTIVMYVALLASMLLSLWTGRKPNKATFELFCYYLMGWAEESDLLAHIEKLREREKTV